MRALLFVEGTSPACACPESPTLSVLASLLGSTANFAERRPIRRARTHAARYAQTVMARAVPSTPGTLSNLQLIAFIHALDRVGVDTDRVLAKVGLHRDKVDPKGRSAQAIDFPLWNAAVEISGDPAIGLRAGKHISYAALGGYGYLLRNSETLEQLLQRA